MDRLVWVLFLGCASASPVRPPASEAPEARCPPHRSPERVETQRRIVTVRRAADGSQSRVVRIAVAPDGVVHVSYDDRFAMSLRHAWGRAPDGVDQDCDGEPL